MADEINDLELTVVSPKFSNSGKKIRSEEIETIAENMSDAFGGVTINPSVLGCWVNEDTDELKCEENIEITSALDTETSDMSRDEAEQFVKEQAGDIAEEFGQAAVMTQESKTEVSFVEGEWKSEIDDGKTGMNPFSELV